MPSVQYSAFLCSHPDIDNYKGEFSFLGPIEKVTEWLKQLPENAVVEIAVKTDKAESPYISPSTFGY